MESILTKSTVLKINFMINSLNAFAMQLTWQHSFGHLIMHAFNPASMHYFFQPETFYL